MTQHNYDHTILAGFREGDVRAFQQVFEEFYPNLCYFAHRLIGDREEAEDIVLDLFTKLWQRKENFETRTNIKAFLYISTRNTCLNFLTYRQRNNAKQKELQYLTDAETSAGSDLELINAEVMQEIHRQVEGLPKQCKEIFKLVFFEGLSTADIAGRMGISTKTVLNQKLKAVGVIRTELLKRKLYLALVVFSCMVDTGGVHSSAA